MKLIRNTLLVLSLSACHQKSRFKSEMLETGTFGLKKGILVSCFRCSCIIDQLIKSKDQIRNITVLGDSLCFPNYKQFKFKQLSQLSIDSIYSKNYNVVFFKIEEGATKFKLVKTEEAVKFRKVVQDFFELENSN